MPSKKNKIADAPKLDKLADSTETGIGVVRQSAPVKNGATVMVGLKLPNGLVLRLQQKVMVDVPVMNGGVKEVTEWRPLPDSPAYVVRGLRTPYDVESPPLIVGGYVMTPGIPLDFWKAWVEQNKNLDVVKNNLIYAETSQARAMDHAKEHKKTVSGMEPMNPESDARAPKKRDRKGKTIEAIGVADEHRVEPLTAA